MHLGVIRLVTSLKISGSGCERRPSKVTVSFIDITSVILGHARHSIMTREDKNKHEKNDFKRSEKHEKKP